MVEVVYVSWREAIELCYRLAMDVARSGYAPDAIVAILRGGVVPALLLSDVLGVENLYAVRVKHWGIAEEVYAVPVVEQVPYERLQGLRVLIVDEVADTGKTLAKAVEEVRKLGASSVKTAVLHLKSSSAFTPDYYAVKLERWIWIFYPWSLAETLLAMAYRELGSAVDKEAVLVKVEELARGIGVEHYTRELIELALDFYAKHRARERR